MWSVKVELVDEQGKTALTNKYEYETAEIARRYSQDIFELLAETEHVPESMSGVEIETTDTKDADQGRR